MFNRIQSAEYSVWKRRLQIKIKHEIINEIVKKVLKTVWPTLGIIHNKMTLGLDGRLWIYHAPPVNIMSAFGY